MSLSAIERKKHMSRASALESVERILRARIAAGYWRPGIMLPSRRDLAKEFEVDLHTLQRAILPLLNDKTLQADGGRGTFVSQDLRDGRDVFLPPVIPQAASRPELGTLGIVAAYDASRISDFDVAGIGTRDILRSLESTFSDANGRTLFFNLFRPNNPWTTVAEAGAALLSQGAKSLAVVGIQDDPLLGDVVLPDDSAGTVPVIYISGSGSYRPQLHVYYDQRQAGYQAAEHLLQIGCRKLTFLVPFAAPWLEERVAGARVALHHASVSEEVLTVYPSAHPLLSWSPEVKDASVAAIRRAFSENKVEEGVITPNDGFAHLFLEIATEYGKHPGRDFALIGFDDLPQSIFCGMTSIRPPFEEMGREAGRLLLRRLDGENVHLQVCLRPHLMVRDSTRQYAAGRPVFNGSAFSDLY